MLRFLFLLYTRTQGEPGRTTSAQSDATKALKAFKHIPLNSYDFQSSSPSAISVFRNNSPFCVCTVRHYFGRARNFLHFHSTYLEFIYRPSIQTGAFSVSDP